MPDVRIFGLYVDLGRKSRFDDLWKDFAHKRKTERYFVLVLQLLTKKIKKIEGTPDAKELFEHWLCWLGHKDENDRLFYKEKQKSVRC